MRTTVVHRRQNLYLAATGRAGGVKRLVVASTARVPVVIYLTLLVYSVGFGGVGC
jgi:hypothetical protein